MRQIHDHKVNGLNEAINVAAVDEPGSGGANHEYQLDLKKDTPTSGRESLSIRFQNGPIKEAGFNGFSNEALLAVLIDRMRGFQGQNPVTNKQITEGSAPPTGDQPRAPYACRENAIALTYLESAMMWLQKRTRDRMARGVEGTHAV